MSDARTRSSPGDKRAGGRVIRWESQPGSSLKAGWSEWCAEHGAVWRFVLKFSALTALFYILVLTPFCDRLLYIYLEANAWLAHGILNGLGQETQLSENTIRAARFALTIRRGCDAIEPSWLFCAAVGTFPAPWGRKFLGMLVGATLLQALNLVRIVSLYFIGLKHPAAFKLMHVEVWPAIFILVAIVLWIVWARRAARPFPHATA